jgi:hypothetical protein
MSKDDDNSFPAMSDEKKRRYRQFSIELDCPPFRPRPNEYIGGVLEGTGLEVGDFETGPPFFGHQVWILKASAGKDDLFTEHKEKTFKPRIEALYNSGAIRYGTW